MSANTALERESENRETTARTCRAFLYSTKTIIATTQIGKNNTKQNNRKKTVAVHRNTSSHVFLSATPETKTEKRQITIMTTE